jgi:hypothetical protein
MIPNPRFGNQNPNSTLSKMFYGNNQARLPKSSHTAYRFVVRRNSQKIGSAQHEHSTVASKIDEIYGLKTFNGATKTSKNVTSAGVSEFAVDQNVASILSSAVP